jgi:hypothetical protein
VRENYSADGDAWRYFPFDHARSRAYRWSEDGLAGLCDREQSLCFALSFWNGRDLKERIFGLGGPEGNHGAGRQGILVVSRRDADRLLAALALSLSASGVSICAPAARNASRTRDEPEFGLLDTGIFDGDRYWQIPRITLRRRWTIS